jgi:hypothetical protein
MMRLLKSNQIGEFELGTRFEPILLAEYELMPGLRYRCVEGEDCLDCLCCNAQILCEGLECRDNYRTDGKSIILEVIENDG